MLSCLAIITLPRFFFFSHYCLNISEVITERSFSSEGKHGNENGYSSVEELEKLQSADPAVQGSVLLTFLNIFLLACETLTMRIILM